MCVYICVLRLELILGGFRCVHAVRASLFNSSFRKLVKQQQLTPLVDLNYLDVVLLERGQVLARLGELALLHSLAHIPVHEGALGVHQIELAVEARPRGTNGRRVAEHAKSARHFGQVAAGHNHRRLVVEADLEARRTPVDKLHVILGLDGRDGRVRLLGHDVAAIEHAARHVLAKLRVALDHLIGRVEDGLRQLQIV